MEQNEEVLIRVYQDKERQYKQQIDELKQKLHNVQQGEVALRKQLRQSEDVQQQLRKSVQSLNDEKLEMQQKCVQIERELSQLRTRVDERRPCDSCRRQQSQQTQSIYENNGLSNGVKPVPAPRLMNSKVSIKRSKNKLISVFRNKIFDLKLTV
jgi:predicted nuclease with TOPRIM domain